MAKLIASVAERTAAADISAVGGLDWFKTGFTDYRKSGATSLITINKQGVSGDYNNAGAFPLSWTGGAPTATGSNDQSYWENSYPITVAVGTAPVLVRVFCWRPTAITLTGTLSDGSAAAAGASTSALNSVFTFEVAAGSANQTLTITASPGGNIQGVAVEQQVIVAQVVPHRNFLHF